MSRFNIYLEFFIKYLLILLFPFLLAHAQTKTDLKELIKEVSQSVRSTGTIDPTQNCPNCQKPVVNKRESAQLYSESNKKNIELSVITLDEANKIVSKFLSMKNIPFDYALDGCFARAHKMATLLDQMGITSGKAFLMGRLFANTKYGPVNWRYHVAPIVYVKENDELVPYVIDPSLSTTAMKYTDWKNLITGNTMNVTNPKMKKVSMTAEAFTNRFVYDPTNLKADYQDYQPGDLADMDTSLARYLDLRNQLDAKK